MDLYQLRPGMLNKWASERTGGQVLRIDGDIGTPSPNSALVTIVSASKITWAHGFRERLTWPTEFLADGNRPQLCQMMHQTADCQTLANSLRDTFGMDLYQLRPGMLNKWASERTGGQVLRIDGDIGTPSPNSALVTIVSASKITWAHGFRERLTWPTEFLADGNRPQLCQMMHQTAEFGYTETAEYQVLSIDTVSPGVKVSFLLPHFGSLDERVSEFTVEKWHEIVDNLTPTTLKVFIPRFKVDSSCHSLVGDFGACGAPDLCQPGCGALVGLTDGLNVDQIIQRSVIEIDETGAEELQPDCLVSCAASCQDYRLDRPFLVVVHQHASILQFAKVASLAAPAEGPGIKNTCTQRWA